jgi:hypothetical protein
MKKRTKIISGMIGAILVLSSLAQFLGSDVKHSATPLPKVYDNIRFGNEPKPSESVPENDVGPDSADSNQAEVRQSGTSKVERGPATEPAHMLKGESRSISKAHKTKGPSLPGIDPPLPSEDGLGAIDRILEQLEFGNIAFNTPSSMNLHNTAVIQLMLGLTTSPDELKRMVEAEGEKVGARIRVSELMEARLTGLNFSITAITAEEQGVARNEVTQWKWEVKPINEGPQSLHLTLEAKLNVNGASISRVIRTFDKVIEVEIGWSQRVGSFFENNWQWLWAAVLVPIVGWLWKWKMGSKSNASQSGS